MNEIKSAAPLFQKKQIGEMSSLKEFSSGMRKLYAWIYPEIRPHRWVFLGVWLLGSAVAAASASPIILVKKIVEKFPNRSDGFILSLCLLAGAMLAISVLEIISTLSQSFINFRLRHSLELKYARHLTSLPLSFYENNSSGNISVTPFTQIPLLTRIIVLISRDFIQAGTTVIIVLIVLLYFDISIGVFAFLLVPFFFLGANKLSQKIQKNITHMFNQISALHSSFLESLVAVKSIRTLGISEQRIKAIFNIIQDTLTIESRVMLYSGGHQLILEFVFAGGVVLLVYLLRLQYMEGKISIAVCTSLVVGFGLLIREVKRISRGIIELRRIVGACSQLLEFISHPSLADPKASFVPSSAVEEIQLEKVGFSYDGKAHILKGVDMVFSRGHITGIIGESGAGKSTLADLLLRLREPASGRILLNGRDFSVYSEDWLRNNFSFVDQEPFMFNTSIRNNFLIACNDITEPEIRHFLSLSSALEFVSKLPEGLDTLVGDDGCLLSVGEKQRIAIARAIAKRPEVLVLDEITSALDAENERTVLKTIKDFSADKIVVMITHKDSAAAICDRIYGLNNGRVYIVKDKKCHV